MSVFADVESLKQAVRGILKSAPDAGVAKRWMRALPGPPLSPLPEGAPIPRGMYFNILGDITVRFNDDGTREATFLIATQPDDPNPQLISEHWPLPGFLTKEQALAAQQILFG